MSDKNTAESIDVESRIIDLVRNRPFLYDTKNVEYKDRMTNLNGWTYIGEQLNLSADSVQKIWESIRKQYTTYLSKLKKKTGSGATPEPYFRHKFTMEFYKQNYRPHTGLTVTNFVEPRSPSTSTNNDNNDDDDEEDEREEINPEILFDNNELEPYLTINDNKDKAKKSRDEDNRSLASTSSSSSSKTKGSKRKTDSLESEFLSLYKNSMEKKKQKDEFDFFGSTISSKLREIHNSSKDKALDAQIDILNAIKKYSE